VTLKIHHSSYDISLTESVELFCKKDDELFSGSIENKDLVKCNIPYQGSFQISLDTAITIPSLLGDAVLVTSTHPVPFYFLSKYFKF